MTLFPGAGINCLLTSRLAIAARRAFFIGAALAALSGCGGGGSGSGGDNGSGSGGNPPATLHVSPTSVSMSATTADSTPNASVQVTVQASSPVNVYIAGDVTHSGVDTLGFTSSDTVGTITIQFKAPGTVGPGTYKDTLTVNGCYDQQCSQQVTGSPIYVSITYVVAQGAAQLNSISPTSVTAGAAAFALTVSGYDFVSSSQVLWNGSPRPTTFVDTAHLTAQIPASDVASSGTANVSVNTGGALSPPLPFTITPLAALSFDQISPRTVAAGSGAFNVSAIGNGFTASSVITWNGTNLETTYFSSTLIRARITPDQVAAPGTVSITVVNPAGQGGTTAAKTLTITAPSLDAVSYQMNPAHTGATTFQNVTLPSASIWSADVGGTPSYALIVGGKVYVTANVNGNSQLLAFDGATGTKLWGPIAFTGAVNAAYGNGFIYVVSGTITTQILSALDPATGISQWSSTVPGSWFPEPPVAADGVVYTANGGAVAAFAGDTGARLWNGIIGGSQGAVAVTPDGVYGSSPCTTTNLQPLVGTVLWYYNSGCSGGGGATPAIADGVLYSPDDSGYSSGTIFDAESGALKGTYAANRIPALSTTTAFIFDNGALQGIARSNNTVLWSFAGDGQLSSAPIVVNNYVFIGSNSGTLYALDSTTGVQVWSKNLGGAIPYSSEQGMLTGLAAGDGLLIVPNGTQVTAYVLSSSP